MPHRNNEFLAATCKEANDQALFPWSSFFCDSESMCIKYLCIIYSIHLHDYETHNFNRVEMTMTIFQRLNKGCKRLILQLAFNPSLLVGRDGACTYRNATHQLLLLPCISRVIYIIYGQICSRWQKRERKGIYYVYHLAT